MKALIVDDENKARNLLRHILTEECNQITEIYEAGNLMEAVEQIKKEQPKLVFLDIEMPQHSGLELLEFIPPNEVNFEIIFTTAYNKYAVDAFALSAVDYLLKPMTHDVVVEAVNKALKKINKNDIVQRLDALRTNFLKGKFSKIAIPNQEGVIFMNLDEIIFFEASGMYTTIFSTQSKETVSKPLKHFVELLEDKPNFYRPHRSYLINLYQMKRFLKRSGGLIEMNNDVSVPVSRDKKEEFVQILQNLIN